MSNEPSKIVQTWHFVTPVDNENIAPGVQQELALVQTKEYIY